MLDDALSSVDTQTEDRILNHLRELMQGRTTIFISHRVSTVRNADRIAVLRDGEIVEYGTHDELIARNGYYTELHDKQLLEEELGNGELCSDGTTAQVCGESIRPRDSPAPDSTSNRPLPPGSRMRNHHFWLPILVTFAEQSEPPQPAPSGSVMNPASASLYQQPLYPEVGRAFAQVAHNAKSYRRP